MGVKSLMLGSCCHQRHRRFGYALAASAAIWCAWMAALGFTWEGITDGTLPPCIPATVSVLGLCLLATCPPPSVLGIVVSLAVVGWKFQALRGAVWVSLWAVGSLSSTFSCCHLLANAPLHVETKDEEAGGVSSAGGREDKEGARRHLLWLTPLVAYLVRLPSSFLMSLLWSIPFSITAVPRVLAVGYFEIVDAVLVSVGGLLIHLGKRSAPASTWDMPPSYVDASAGRTPVILVGAPGREAQWIVPRLHFLRKSLSYGPVLVFESEGMANGGIAEMAQELQEFILSSDVLDSSNQRLVLVGHSVGGLVCAYFSDILAPQSGIRVGSVVCISTPWAGFQDAEGAKGWVQRLRAIGARCWVRAQNFSAKMQSDLQAGSKVLEEIQALQVLPSSSRSESRPRFYNLAGSLDPLMADSLDIARRNAFWCCILPHVGHSSVLLSRTVWEQIFIWLDSATSTSRKALNAARAQSAPAEQAQKTGLAPSATYAQSQAAASSTPLQNHGVQREIVGADAGLASKSAALAGVGEERGLMLEGLMIPQGPALPGQDTPGQHAHHVHGSSLGTISSSSAVGAGGNLRCKMLTRIFVADDEGSGRVEAPAGSSGSPSKGPAASKKRPPVLGGSGLWGAGAHRPRGEMAV